MQKAAFLDRDGVINVDSGYVHKKEDVVFMPGIFRLCRLLSENGFRLVIITNQSGIARGLYSVKDFHKLTLWMKKQFAGKSLPAPDVYFCPHHPDEGKGTYKKDCDCRKPKPGMIFQARQQLDLDLANSLLIGDQKKRHSGRPGSRGKTLVSGKRAPR